MTFEQLDYFIAAVESDTFLDASEKLHITQSTLSKQMKKLESELDLTLFDRRKRRADLTPAGHAFYVEAIKISKQYHTSLLKMNSFRSVASNKLCIGTLPFLAQYDLTKPIRKFRKLHPEITFSLSEVEEQELISGLDHDTFELIITRETMIDRSCYQFRPIAEDTLSVILPKDHPLADHSSLSLKDLKQESFILMHPYTSIYQLCQKLFSKAEIIPDVRRTARVESIINAVQIGEGIGLFPERNFLLFRHDGLVAIPLMDAPILQIGITYKNDRKLSPIAHVFLQYCTNLN